jgi:hypothetical protein
MSSCRCRSNGINKSMSHSSKESIALSNHLHTIFQHCIPLIIMNLGRMASKSIVNKAVGPVGYGMLGLTVPWAPLEHEVAASLLKRALERGANLWNTVCFHCSVYGSPNFG